MIKRIGLLLAVVALSSALSACCSAHTEAAIVAAVDRVTTTTIINHKGLQAPFYSPGNPYKITIRIIRIRYIIFRQWNDESNIINRFL